MIDVGTAAWQHAHHAAGVASSHDEQKPVESGGTAQGTGRPDEALSPGMSVLMGAGKMQGQGQEGEEQGQKTQDRPAAPGVPHQDLSSTEMPPQPGAGVPKESML